MNKIEKILWQVNFEKRHNWLKAKELLTKGIIELPTNRELLFSLAMLYQSKKLYKKAIEQYQLILQTHSQDEKAIFQIANCFLFFKEYRLAINYMDMIKKPHPELLYNKAYAHSKLHDLDASIQILENINDSVMQTEIPNIFLAELFFAKRKYKKALDLLNVTEKNFGKRGTINYLRGLIFINKRNYLNAYVELNEADKLKIKNSHFYRNFSIACQEIGKTIKAIEILMKSIKEFPFDVNSYVDLIKLYVKLRRTDEAYAISQQARKIFPYSASLSILHANIKGENELNHD